MKYINYFIKNIKEQNINCDYDYFRKIIKNGYFEFKIKKTSYCIGYVDLKELKNVNYIKINKNKFHKFLAELFKEWMQEFCNKKDFSISNIDFGFKNKLKFVLFFSTTILFFVVYFPNLLFVFCFLPFVISFGLKNLYFLYSLVYDKEVQRKKEIRELKKNITFKKYSILIPLYKEKEIIKQIFFILKEIQYPKELLDVKIIVEKDDIETKKEAYNKLTQDLFFVEIVEVPYFEPRTKPKALNYAVLFSDCEYLVVYDAEDFFDRDQILISNLYFNKIDKNIFALQCRLSYYNYNDNILTFLFQMEYLSWFRFTTRGMCLLFDFLPLGGSSNHFRFNVLEKIGFWDSHNVTEDLEIAIRAYSQGYRIKMISSDTKEWAVDNLKAWIKQRIRWMKGYLLTYFVYLKDKKNLKKKDFKFQIVLHFVVGHICFYCLGYIFLVLLFFDSSFLNKNNPLVFFLYNAYIFVCFSFYFLLFLFLFKSSKKIKKVSKVKVIFSFLMYPFYFFLHFLSSCLAFYEIFRKPFYWDKTNHPCIKK